MGCLLFLLIALRVFLDLVKKIASAMFGASGISAQGSGKATPINAVAATSALKQYLTPYKIPLPTTVQFVSEFDFHQIVASTGDFPELMRKLGLVLDLSIPLDAAIPRPTGTVKIEVVWSAIPSHTRLFSPRTYYELNDAPDAPSFITRARDSSGWRADC